MTCRNLILGATVAAAALAGPAKADQLDDIIANKTLRCATFADVPPFAAPDAETREMVGFDVDLCGAIARELGVKAEVKPVSVEARVPEVKLGRRRHHRRQPCLHEEPRRADPVQRPLLSRERDADRSGGRCGQVEGRLCRPAHRLHQGLDLGNVDQAQQVRSTDLPGIRRRPILPPSRARPAAWSPTP